MNLVWNFSKESLQDAGRSLPVVPRRVEVDWMSNELRNLSRKKRDAWIRVRECDPRLSADALVQEYQRLRNLTKVAAERARSA